jgi:hypothetical protein
MMRVVLLFLAVALTTADISETIQSNEMWGPEMIIEPTENDFGFLQMYLEVSDVTPTPPASEASVPAPSAPAPAKPSTWDNIVGAFGKLVNKWGAIVDAFKTTRNSEIKEKLIGKGFDYFKDSAQIQISKGVKAEYVDQYLSHLETRIKVPSDRQEDLKMSLEEIKWADSTIWSAFDTLFSIDTQGNVKYASILASRNDQGNYDFVYTDVKAEFKLSPDILVIKKSLSVLGGIWQDEKTEHQKVPKSLNPEDVQTVIQFFQIVAFKGFAEQFGFKIEFPKL